MLQIILKIIGFILMAFGVILVYDARVLTEKWFGFGDQNEASSGLKILGFILCFIGGLVCQWGRFFLKTEI